MSKHTEGKIEAFTEESFSGWFALRQITDDGLNHEIGSGDGGLFEPDARRLAAAWNAFEGMPTESIEESMGCDGVMGIICYAGDTQEELNAARALLREVIADTGIVTHIDACQRAQEYLDACDTLEGNKPVDATGCRKCGDILPDVHYCKAPACPLNPSMKGK